MQIHTLDLHYQNEPQAIAAYLIIGPDGPVLVETGPGSTLENLLAGLAKHDLHPTDIKHLLVTHIHLDHAGAAGWWAQRGTQVYVHHIGAPHLIDPSKLLASARRIYGDQMDRLWGQIVPAPADKVTVLHDGDLVEVCGLSFRAIETPGHAWHHHSYRLGDVAFVGDAIGWRIPDTRLIDVPAPPPEFKLEVWQQTLDKLAAEKLTAVYPTHFGRVDDVTFHLSHYKQLLVDTAVFIRQQMKAGQNEAQIVQSYEVWNRQRAKNEGASEEIIERYARSNPWYMTVQGIMRYWRKQGIGER